MLSSVLSRIARLRGLGSAGALEEATATEPRARRSLALGIERVGLVSFRHLAIVGAVAAMLAAIAVTGIARLQVDDSLTQLFRSETRDFTQYARAVAASGAWTPAATPSR